MLKTSNVWHAARQRQRCDVNFAFPLVILQDFRNVRMNLKLVEVNFIGAKQRDQFDPFDHFDGQIIVEEIQTLDTNSETFFAIVDWQIINTTFNNKYKENMRLLRVLQC